jgi:predicted CoA-substrate-specific enzyme activase
MTSECRLDPGEVQNPPDHHTIYRMGIDIGSVSAKVVVLDPQAEILFSDYRRHRAEAWATIYAILQEALQSVGDIPISLMITGSAGMGVSERYAIPFIQEVIASAEVIRQLYPRVRTLVDIGGEDAKVIFFGADGVPDIRMNGSCAGGTGAYIDEMATLLNVSVSDLSGLAEQHTQIYPMASRCGVFGKTDVQNLLSREVDRADIAASILHAVVLQTLATLARGIETEPLLLFSGGPLTFVPALRAAFISELNLEPEDILEAPHMELLPAMGAALADSADKRLFHLSELLEILSDQNNRHVTGGLRLAPLFTDEFEWRNWEEARSKHHIERVPFDQVEGEPCFLGVDSGSTTSKVVVIDQRGRVMFTHYTNNNGNAIRATQDGMQKLRQSFEPCIHPPIIARSVATGYGEDLIRAAFGLDQGIVETLAHYQAAKAFDQDVSFIMDIGGQDMKAIFVRDKYIYNLEINEACSSGCGTFIETFARAMGYGVADFAQKACASGAPCDLGSRCTVFMNSRIKQSLKEAAEIGDISAGLAYSVIKNALHKVLKISNTAELGEHIVVQGGTFRNPAVQRAFEKVLGKEVVCPDMAELMGAYGAALAARDAWLIDGHTPGRFIGLEALESAANYEKRLIQCRGCENRCSVTKLIFANGGIFYTGNRCERIYSNHGKKFVKGTSLTNRKLELLFDRPMEPDNKATLTIGVPRALNTYEDFPFWNTLLVECGFKVQLSDTSSSKLYGKGAGTVMSENICFPAKLVHGHILDLIDKRVDRIFYPMVFAEHQKFVDASNSYNCPIITGYPDVVRSAIDPLGKHGIPLDMPSITFQDEKLLRQACYHYLHGLGVSYKRFLHAFQKANAAQQKYKEAVRAEGARILEKAQKEGRLVVLLMGRPYHLDPLINHGVPQILVDLGVDVITEDAVPLEAQPRLENRHVPTQWEYVNRFYYAARWAGQQAGVEVVQLNSFACGPDAYTLDEIKTILDSLGKGYTSLRIDEIESTGSTRLRLRSLIETLRAEERLPRSPRPRKQIKLFEVEDRQKVVLVPHFSHFCAPVIAGPVLQMGYKIETLPPPDRESVEIGLRHTQNEVCYPGIILIGDVIKALQSGKYDLSNVVVGSWQTGGQCRATSVLSLVKRALINAGYQDIPIVALTPNRKLFDQPGYDLNLVKYTPKALLAALYGDSISAMYHATAIREQISGQSLALADALLEPLNKGILPLNQESVLKSLKDSVARFNNIATTDRNYPKVGIVGEIYVKFNSFSNNYAAQWLMGQGIEVILPYFLEFFLGWFVSTNVRVKENIQRRNFSWLLANLLDRKVQGVLSEAGSIMEDFKYHRPHHNIHEIARAAQEVVSLTHAYGEGWLIAGEISTLAENGVPNVLCLQPFGCIANQVTARGVAKRLKERHKDLNLLFLDVDAGISEVNYFNRMHFFVSQAKSMA